MLVVISDLHLIDGTAGQHNPRQDLFEEVFLNWLPELAQNRGAKEFKVLLLGDIVDLIRTERWLDKKKEDESDTNLPWGESGLQDIDTALRLDPLDESDTQRHCLQILKNIVSENESTFELFRNLNDNFNEKVGLQEDLPVELIYVPGNHDRLCNVYPEVRNLLRDKLGLTVNVNTVDGNPEGDWWYRHDFEDENYGVYARHGHEYDVANYGNTTNYERAGQIRASFGEVFATEFVVKVPWLVRGFIESGEYDIEGPGNLISRLKEVDNLRPPTSVLAWFRRCYGEGDRGKVVEHALEQTIDEFLDIEFVKQWRRSGTFWDGAVRAATTPRGREFTSRLQRSMIRRDFLPLIQKGLSAMLNRSTDPAKDEHTKAAHKDVLRLDNNIRYVLYGHTHDPVIHPLEVPDDREVMYINTGTWRERLMRKTNTDTVYKRFSKVVKRNETPPLVPVPTEFTSLNQITYAVFYRADEYPGREPNTPSFDMWTGSGSRVAV